ncbi:MAG TPA: dihydrodipicolinate reductase C-terminal domain-containing protein [Gemmatimonadaceae bacterium]
MKIALIGNGKMGQAIAPLAIARGHTITATLGERDNPHGNGISRDALGAPDVAIEFTEPASAAANVRACARTGVAVVVGTTGWYEELDAVIAEVRKLDGTMFWAPNFSVGVALLSAAIEAASAALRGVPGFDVHLVETHHAAKKDRPSGTAASLAKIAERELGREVPITSVRTGHVPGTHELVIDAPFEQLRLVHEARDRRVFADGAISAAEWLQGRKGVFTMSDVLRHKEDAR